MKRHLLAAPILAISGLTGCATLPSQPSTSAPAMVKTISGTVSYRERIALPPGAQLEIVVSDITLGENSELILSREVKPLDRRGPPLPFSIDVSKLNVSSGPLYGLRAFIREPDGSILFRTSQPFLLNLKSAAVNVGDIALVSTTPDDPGLAGLEGVKDGQWRITQIGNDVVSADTAPVVTFALDGRFFGSTGCNSFTSNYALEGSKLDLQAAAVTKRACDPGLLLQERRFLEAISVVERAGLDRDGRLVLSGNGQRLVAERK